jgi:hypothetical protein
MANEVNDINITQHIQYIFLHCAVYREGDKII